MDIYTIIFIVALILSTMGYLIYYRIKEEEKNWYVEHKGKGSATRGMSYTDMFDETIKTVFVLERNCETNERRAYIKEMDGTKHSIDVDWLLVELESKGVTIKD